MYKFDSLAFLLQDEKKITEDELKKIISEALKINSNHITLVKTLGGLTNSNYKVIVNEIEYAVRVPGVGTEKFIKRSAEKKISHITHRLGINPKAIYFNEFTGLKIVECIPEAETLSVETGKKEDNLVMVAGILRNLHQAGEDFGERFDVFEKIDEYEKVMNELNCTLIEDYNEVKKQVLQLKSIYKSINIPLVSCHIDPVPENFIKSSEKKLYLIDWEYAGMNDPLWDLAAYIIEVNLSPSEETLFLLHYFNHEVNEEDKKRLLMNKIFQDFLWTCWAMIKVANGEDFNSYGIARFSRAKSNLNAYFKIQKEEEEEELV